MRKTWFFLRKFSRYERFLAMSIVVFCAVFFVFGWWKYTHFRYDALDLGIYTQVFFNTLRGNFFGMTIHPHSYLGDHVEFILLTLLPFFALWENALMLVFLQVVWMGLGAVPLFCIARRVFSDRLAFFTAFLYLTSAFTHNILAFEFHALSFAVPLSFCFFLAYERKKYVWFLLCMVLLFVTREDVALTVLFFSFIPLLEKRSWKWWFVPFVLSVIWFFVALRITTHFSGYEQYKFAAYYGWLGTQPFEIARNIFNPLIVLPKIFTFDKVFFLLALFVSFAGLPFLRSKYLLPIVPIFAQFLLTGGSAGEAILKSHYVSLLLPWLFIASVYGFARTIRVDSVDHEKKAWPLQRVFLSWIRFEPNVSQFLIVVIFLYTFFTLSPLPAFAWQAVRSSATEEIKRAVYDAALNSLHSADRVATTYRILPNVAAREGLYSAHYIFKGTKQLSNEAYPVPGDVDAFVYDSSVMREFELQWLVNGKKDVFFSGDDRLREFLEKNDLVVKNVLDDVLVFRRGDEGMDVVRVADVSHIAVPRQDAMPAGLRFLGYRSISGDSTSAKGVSFVFQKEGDIHDSYWVHLRVRGEDGRVLYEKSYALGYGIWPAESWEQGVPMEVKYWMVFPEFEEQTSISFQLETIQSGLFSFDGVRSVRPTKEKILPLSQEIPFAL